MTIHYQLLESPIGDILVAATTAGISRISLLAGTTAVTPATEWESSSTDDIEQLRGELESYFAGEARPFQTRLAVQGTPFQRSVWNSLREIPFGETTTYGQIAARIGKPKASRAVGAANGRNPWPIVIPCHRVIGKSGKLVGYGGGLHLKKQLLALEQQQSLFDEARRQ